MCVSGWYKGKVARGKLLLFFLVELYFVAVVRVVVAVVEVNSLSSDDVCGCGGGSGSGVLELLLRRHCCCSVQGG